MTPTMRRAKIPGYVALFPDWQAERPLAWYMAENLLEARRAGAFPTNSRGPDEEVNVYLIHLLTQHVGSVTMAEMLPAGAPLLHSPAGSRVRRAEYYRRNGDQRLLCLGLYGRGELQRRRRVPWGWTDDDWRQRELVDGRSCYELAAVLLRRCRPAGNALARVLEKLAASFADYVGVLESLALSRFGLGTRLSHAALRELTGLSGAPPSVSPATAADAHDALAGAGYVSKQQIDDLLDRLLEHRRSPGPLTKALLDAAAARAGIEPWRVSGPHPA